MTPAIPSPESRAPSHLEFSHFDVRHYPTVSVREGYDEWSATYEQTVKDLLPMRLLDRLTSVSWSRARRAVDLACGTGRTGQWLREHGVRAVDGVDFSEAMLAHARRRGAHDELAVADITRTGLPGGRYDLAVQVLADEHLPSLAPLYAEVSRLTTPDGTFVIVGYHPFFLFSGIPPHFHPNGSEAPRAIESYVHLTSDHFKAARAAGWELGALDEGIVDDDAIAAHPRWERYRNRPMSYAMVWSKR
jgi:SAM-dependent methyltransferase